MAIRIVHAKHLHGIATQAKKWREEAASLFPFFQRAGNVPWVMVVAPKRPDIFFFRNTPGTIKKSDDRIVIKKPLQTWHDLRTSDQNEIAALYHYDPWWVLGEKRFHGNKAVPILKATNIVDTFIRHPVEYSEDLMQVQGEARQALTAPRHAPDPHQFHGWKWDPIWAAWAR